MESITYLSSKFQVSNKHLKMKHFLILCLVGVSLAGPLKDHTSPLFAPWRNTSDDGFIIGGVPAKDGQVPWQVSLQRSSGFHFCGGSIISDEWILTATHCVIGLSASQLQIRYNTLASNSGGQLVKIQSVYTHPDYNKGAQVNNDVALLRTASKMTLGGVNAQVIPLADPKSDPSSGELLISGWGDLREGANAGTTTLQVVQVPLISRPRCQSLYAGTYTINENMLCAAIPEGGKDSCQGDSGGPAVINGKLEGIVSFGYGCARANKPGVYARVANYLDWIKSKGVPV